MLFLELVNIAPVLITLYLFVFSIYKCSSFYLFSFLAQFTGIYINRILKEFLFKTIYSIFGTKTSEGIHIPLLGIGNRPLDAMCCDEIFNCKNSLSKTFGMPSGHAQSISILISMFISHWWRNEKGKNSLEKTKNIINKKWEWLLLMFMIALGIFYTRVFYTKCHTTQQVLLGYISGALIGWIFHNIYVKYGETFFHKEKII